MDPDRHPGPGAPVVWVRRKTADRARCGVREDKSQGLTPPPARSIGEPLSGAKWGGRYWKYLVGDWRIVCDVDDERIVVRVLRIGNRRDVYR